MAEWFVNRAREPLSWTVPSRDPLAFHATLPGYAPTPLVDATGIAASIGVRSVLVKDESSRLGLPSFKILGASWAVARALPGWKGVAPPVLVAATEGNHGRAVARVAANLGLRARIFMPSATAAARAQAIEGEGAEVVEVDGTYDDAVDRAAACGPGCLVVSDTAWPGYEQIPRWVIEGYSTLFHEVDDTLAGHDADLVVVPLGVGSLGAACVRHYAARDVRVVGVEPADAACVLAALRAGSAVRLPGPFRSVMNGLNCGLASPVALPDLRAGLSGVVAIEDDDVPWCLDALASRGVHAGPTGAASLAGLRALAGLGEAGPTTRALVLVTEGQ